ncbi:MAG: hypothetical protein IV090_05740 [Candidatus Sericytochromatia bacterium]|nr:hypothetical protein [Candidatus Sericytochromatia bacterium]
MKWVAFQIRICTGLLLLLTACQALSFSEPSKPNASPLPLDLQKLSPQLNFVAFQPPFLMFTDANDKLWFYSSDLQLQEQALSFSSAHELKLPGKPLKIIQRENKFHIQTEARSGQQHLVSVSLKNPVRPEIEQTLPLPASVISWDLKGDELYLIHSVSAELSAFSIFQGKELKVLDFSLNRALDNPRKLMLSSRFVYFITNSGIEVWPRSVHPVGNELKNYRGEKQLNFWKPILDGARDYLIYGDNLLVLGSNGVGLFEPDTPSKNKGFYEIAAPQQMWVCLNLLLVSHRQKDGPEYISAIEPLSGKKIWTHEMPETKSYLKDLVLTEKALITLLSNGQVWIFPSENGKPRSIPNRLYEPSNKVIVSSEEK